MAVLLDFGFLGLVLDLDEVRQRNRHQDADDHDDHQQFDKRKAFTHKVILLNRLL
jgi:hypothetical protein